MQCVDIMPNLPAIHRCLAKTQFAGGASSGASGGADGIIAGDFQATYVIIVIIITATV